jgi:hypothetical protein
MRRNLQDAGWVRFPQEAGKELSGQYDCAYGRGVNFLKAVKGKEARSCVLRVFA